tara:strand:- start:2370 stop:3044 length:675 start_codon:yes stop_codon:yes gene_type:complete
MANWKKLATYNTAGEIEGDISGKANGGLKETLGITGGGTNTDMSTFPTDSLLAFNGNEVTAIPSGSDNSILTTEGGSWVWKDVKDMHSHDGDYLSLAAGGTVSGTLSVAGALNAESVQIQELQQITQADGMSVVLNSGGSSSTGDNAGIFLNQDGSGNTVATDDPAILWSHGDSRWKMGEYTSGGEKMHNIAMVQLGVNPVNNAATDKAGMLATNSSGDVFLSV